MFFDFNKNIYVDYLFFINKFFLGVNHIKQELPINEQIRFKEVQVIDEQGQKIGKLPISKALEIAISKELDLVLVSANTDNPVCKIMNYGKHKFEQAKREKESRKKQKTVECKELRVTPNIEIHEKCKKIFIRWKQGKNNSSI